MSWNKKNNAQNNILYDVPYFTEWATTTIIESTYIKGRIGWQGLRASEFTQIGPFLVTGTDFYNGKINWDNCYHVSLERFNQAPSIHLKNDDVLITKDGTIGKIAFVKCCPEKAILNSGIFVLRCKNNSYENGFLYFILSSQFFKNFLTNSLGGSTINHLYQRVFEKFCFPLPSIPEQQKIVQILFTVDTIIEKTEATIVKYKAIKQGMIHDLFTRGLDKDGKLRPRYEDTPDLYKYTELGWVPKEWDIKLLDSVTFRGSGHTPNKNYPSYWNGGVKWVSLSDTSKLDQIYIYETEKEISELGIANSSAVKHPAGTVILSRDAGIGKSAILAETMAVSQHFIAWRCLGSLNNLYLYYWLQYMKPVFENIAIGSTIKTIGLPFFKSLMIPLPTLTFQKIASDSLLAIDKLIMKYEVELVKYIRIKQALMSDIITGRVRLKLDEESTEVVS